MKYLAKPNSDLMFQPIHVQTLLFLNYFTQLSVFKCSYLNVKLICSYIIHLPSALESLRCGFRVMVWLANLEKLLSLSSDPGMVFRKR